LAVGEQLAVGRDASDASMGIYLMWGNIRRFFWLEWRKTRDTAWRAIYTEGWLRTLGL
jgi:hypothetical protein